ncbi:translation initiation factor IF-2-like [Prionailurus bengalensis]|uniref:translation initiation factor IF-2-like n=1 Tax=Prionailurus bengalensis TaxID=37029 RepID=UPI001CA92C38|nr:translation initiation factor IF-2-like [Prionailurus bengalensis]
MCQICPDGAHAPSLPWRPRGSALQAAPALAKARPEVCPPLLCKNWARRRAQEAPGPPGRPVPRGRRALAPAADASAKVPSKLGGERSAARGRREEGRSARVSETRRPREPGAPGRGAAPTCRARAAAGTCAVTADSRASGAAGTAGGAGGGEEEGPEGAPRCAAARNSPPGFALAWQGWGEAVPGPGALPLRLAATAGPKGSRGRASVLLPVSSLFSQSLVTQPHQPMECSLALLLLFSGALKPPSAQAPVPGALPVLSYPRLLEPVATIGPFAGC